MKFRLKSIARLFFRKNEKRMQSKVRPSSKSPTKLPRRRDHTLKSENDEDSDDNTTSATLCHSSSASSSFSTSTSSTSTSTKSTGSIPKKTKLCCDKCDGKHETSQCPHYKTKRGSHPDEQKNFYLKLGGVSSLPGQTLRSARVVRQPGDGSCLFHSMSHGTYHTHKWERRFLSNIL